MFFGFFCTPFDEFNPLFLFFAFVNFFVFVFMERNITVLVTI